LSLRAAFVLFLMACLLILLPIQSFSQTLTTGDITGYVQDATGAVVPGATVTVKSADTGEVRTTQSNEAGQYRFSC
jgi:Carboxypeptidase regulatory-like domain